MGYKIVAMMTTVAYQGATQSTNWGRILLQHKGL